MKEIRIISIVLLSILFSCNKEEVEESIMPIANFSIKNKHTIKNDTIYFINNSSNGTTFIWNFGDGSTSTEASPSHIYPNEGKYLITLSISNDDGSHTKSESLYIYTDTVVDIDNNVYYTIKIGNQEWMAENLNVSRYPNGDSIDYVHDYSVLAGNYNSGMYCYYSSSVRDNEEYGALYNWIAAMGNDTISSYNGDMIQGISPNGWHIPSVDEWNELINYLGGDSIAGDKLKFEGHEYWSEPNTNATNSSLFSALAGGYLNPTPYSLNYEGLWWTSNFSYKDNLNVYSVELSNNKSSIFIGGGLQVNTAISIRCIKNQ